MRRLIAIVLAASACSVAAEPVQYNLDPTHSFATFEVLHFGTSTVRGRFGPLSGEVTLDREAKKGRVQIVVDMARFSTGVPPLDARLKEPDLLALEANPKGYFVAERFDFDAAGAVRAVRGELTLRGTSQPLELKAERFNCYQNLLFKREVCGGDFVGEVNRSAFGMDFGLPFVADRVRVVVQVEGIRQ